MKDRWIKAAFSDDKLVAELLIRLHQSSSSTSSSHPPPPPLPRQLVLPLWGQKQPRSTPLRKYSAGGTRFSPRTPLSWSGGGATGSPSDAAGDESTVSCAKSEPFSASRSKNFSQLKEEESGLLDERVNLKRDLKSIHVNLKEQRNWSDNMKRIKFDLNQQSIEGGSLSTEPEVLFANHHGKMEASTTNHPQSILPRHAIKEERALTNSCGLQVAETNKSGFVLPDLNMPVGDDEIAAEPW